MHFGKPHGRYLHPFATEVPPQPEKKPNTTRRAGEKPFTKRILGWLWLSSKPSKDQPLPKAKGNHLTRRAHSIGLGSYLDSPQPAEVFPIASPKMGISRRTLGIVCEKPRECRRGVFFPDPQRPGLYGRRRRYTPRLAEEGQPRQFRLGAGQV